MPAVDAVRLAMLNDEICIVLELLLAIFSLAMRTKLGLRLVEVHPLPDSFAIHVQVGLARSPVAVGSFPQLIAERRVGPLHGQQASEAM